MINANGKRYLKGMNLSISEYINQSEQLGNSLLCAQFYAEDVLRMNTDLSVPILRVPMARLGEVDSICVVWQGSGLPKSGQYEAINYRYDDNLLFGVIELSETMFDENMDKTPLQQATESAYSQIFSLLDKLSFPYLFRIWNYMADINDQSFGLERYVQFNLGRQDAFLSHGRDVVGNVPAACALGFESTFDDKNAPHNSLIISFLAGRVKPQYIENPRQISAYQYPQQYGSRSPTFSRASLVTQGSDELLFLSGTASIVGHKTLHPNDVVAQTRETIANINAVLIELNSRDSEMKFGLSDLHYTVYVRHIEDLEAIRNELKLCVGAELNAVYLQANVCRQDLLLEIEATAGHSMGNRSSHSESKDLSNERAN
jgi:chorismate lyase/3-hydroxybenzoate synthase